MNYTAKGKDSFRTKFNIYLFKHIISPESAPIEFDSFRDYEIEQEIVKLNTTQYWQRKVDFQIRERSIKQIESEIITFKNERKDLIKDWECRYEKEIFTSKFPRREFDSVCATSKCAYCSITLEEIDLLIVNGLINKKRLRGFNLEMDRKNSNYEYSPENCVMCCYWCNNAKTDEFDEREYQLIGDSVRRIWQARLSLITDKK